MLTDNLNQIILDCRNDFANAGSVWNIVPDSVPVLWFGDIEAYRKSSKRIVSVALNPSDQEFGDKKGGPYKTDLRFEGLSFPYVCDEYYKAMNSYFRNNPLKKWFNSVELILNELDASYYSNRANTAVHIDIEVPVATVPTWGSLPIASKENLSASFGSYFSRMLDELNPEVIVISTNRDIIATNFNNREGMPCTPQNADVVYEGGNNAFLRGYDLGKRVLITGLNMRGTAFAALSPEDRQKGLKAIKDKLFNA